MKQQFGTDISGNIAAEAAVANAMTLPEHTTDKLHRGAFSVVQPKKGHRAGLDAMLLAAAVPRKATGILADLGAGCCAAGLAALNLNGDLDLLCVENNEQMLAFAEATLALPQNAKLRMRAKILNADITLSGNDRVREGLLPEFVSHVLMNPPYNTISLRPPENELKHDAYMLGAGGVDAWFRTAASITRPGGSLVVIYRTENLGDLLACCQGRFGGLEIMPIHSRDDEPAKRILVRGTRGSKAPLAIVPGFVVHRHDGSYTPQAEAIFAGEEFLSFT